MKALKFIFPILLAALVQACSPSTTAATENTKADSTVLAVDTSLIAKMQISELVKVGEPLEMTFTVYNKTGVEKKFLKWHTPFETPLSKYLDIISHNGEEAAYKGAMAKRVMPPPADSYITIKPGDSLSTKIDLNQSYLITSTGLQTVHYNAESISGLKVTDVKFNLEKEPK